MLEEKAFHLISEPWIRVRTENCEIMEVSLTDVFHNAHCYLGLAGELPTQDVAILRLLLAVLHAVFYDHDENGIDSKLTDEEDAFDRWEALWEMGTFPMEPIEMYLDKWSDRFWLFHPERPFYQVPSAIIGTAYKASKMNGELSESNHKQRLFPCRNGEDKDILSYSEAARWLIHTNAYEDAGGKKQGSKEEKKELESIGVGWVGECGILYAIGKNLFQTLLLNLVLTDDKGSIWGSALPVWERNTVPEKQRERIIVPHDQADLLTLQSRRLLLERNDVCVTGHHSLGGSFFEKQNAFNEQMTLWEVAVKKNTPDTYLPYLKNTDRFLWQDFNVIAALRIGSKTAGVVRWLCALQQNRVLPKDAVFSYTYVSVKYDKNRSSIERIFCDSLSFRLNLLSELGRACAEVIYNEIALCDEMARIVGTLALELNIAAGGKGDDYQRKAKEQFYYRIDIPFRQWLQTLDAADDFPERNKKCEAWRQTERRIAEQYGEELVKKAGAVAFTGKKYKVKDKDAEKHYSIPEAYNHFHYQMRTINNKENIKKG